MKIIKAPKTFFFLIIAIPFATFYVKAQILLHPYNLDFEDASAGSMPYGWIVPGYAQALNYKAEATTDNPASGRLCLELRNQNKLEDGAYGSVMQSIDVKAYRGNRFVLKALIRTDVDSIKSSAHLWAKVIREDNKEGFFDWMQDNPIRTKEWSYFEISGIIDEDANEMNFGLLLMGTGKAWIDKVSLEFLSKELPAYDSSYAISKLGLKNLKALFKIYGYVRYFYAGDECQATNWDNFLVNSIPFIENSKNNIELLENLRKLFYPIAPALKIIQIDKQNELVSDSNVFKSKINNIALCWRHDGFPIQAENPYITSKIVNIFMPQNRAEGAVSQVLNADKYRGKKIKFVCMAKAELYNSYSQGQLWLRLDKEGEKTIKVFTNDNQPIVENKWREYSIGAEIPDNASFIRLGLILLGDGVIWFDNAKLFVEDKNGKLEEIEIKNPGFEQGSTGELVFGWKIASASEKAYYKAEITDEVAFMGKKSLKLSSDKENLISLPKENEVFFEKINEEFVLSMPLTVYVDSNGTLPKPKITDNSLPKFKPDDFILSPNDRTSRLAVVAILWNLIKHFSYLNNKNLNLDSVLDEAITKSSLDKNAQDFEKTLNNMLLSTNDTQAKIWYGKKDVLYRFPFLWEFLDNKIFISKLYDSSLGIDVGDEILKINNIDIFDTINTLMKNYKGKNRLNVIAKILEEIRSGNYRSLAIFKIKKSNGKIIEKEVERFITPNELVYKEFPPVSELIKDIFYVDLTKFDDRQFKETIKQMISAKGIIFDLRGYSTISDHFLGFFIKKPLESIKTLIPIFTKPNQELISTKIIRTFITPRVLPSDPAIIFLMNEFSSGNSEALLNIIKDYGIAEIVGRESSGTGGEIIQFRLGADFYASLTAIFPLDRQNNLLFIRTIKPNIKIERIINDVLTGRDEILESAYEYLLTKIH